MNTDIKTVGVLTSGIAAGAEQVLIPETYDGDEKRVMEKVAAHRATGKNNNILINAEGVGRAEEIAEKLEEAGGIRVRTTTLSYIQRGGNPTCRDRVYASIMGAKAIDLLAEGARNRVVVYRNGIFTDYDIDEALTMESTMKDTEEYIIDMLESLTR